MIYHHSNNPHRITFESWDEDAPDLKEVTVRCGSGEDSFSGTIADCFANHADCGPCGLAELARVVEYFGMNDYIWSDGLTEAHKAFMRAAEALVEQQKIKRDPPKPPTKKRRTPPATAK